LARTAACEVRVQPGRYQRRVPRKIVAPAAGSGDLQACHHADDGGGCIAAVGVHHLADRIALREQLVRQLLGNDGDRAIAPVAETLVLHVAGIEGAAGHQTCPQRGQHLLVGEVVRRTGIVLAAQLGARLVRNRTGPGGIEQRQRVDRRHRSHVRQLAQSSEVLALHGIQLFHAIGAVGVGCAHPLLADQEQVALVQAGGAVHPVDALADDEDRIAHDRQRQRDLQCDQYGAGLVLAQCREDGMQFHEVFLSLSKGPAFPEKCGHGWPLSCAGTAH